MGGQRGGLGYGAGARAGGACCSGVFTALAQHRRGALPHLHFLPNTLAGAVNGGARGGRWLLGRAQHLGIELRQVVGVYGREGLGTRGCLGGTAAGGGNGLGLLAGAGNGLRFLLGGGLFLFQAQALGILLGLQLGHGLQFHRALCRFRRPAQCLGLGQRNVLGFFVGLLLRALARLLLRLGNQPGLGLGLCQAAGLGFFILFAAGGLLGGLPGLLLGLLAGGAGFIGGLFTGPLLGGVLLPCQLLAGFRAAMGAAVLAAQYLLYALFAQLLFVKAPAFHGVHNPADGDIHHKQHQDDDAGAQQPGDGGAKKVLKAEQDGNGKQQHQQNGQAACNNSDNAFYQTVHSIPGSVM